MEVYVGGDGVRHGVRVHHPSSNLGRNREKVA